MKRQLVVVTHLSGEGFSGVETHLNQIIHYATKLNINAKLTNPYQKNLFWHRLYRLILTRLSKLNQNFFFPFVLFFKNYLLFTNLKKNVAFDSAVEIYLYAQDINSANVCVKFKKKFNKKFASGIRVIQVVHFTVSEADEYVQKKIFPKYSTNWNMLRKIELNAVHSVDKLIFVSNYMRNILNDRYEISHIPQKVIHNFPRIPHHNNNISLSGDLICIGALEPNKNQHFLLEIISQCRKQGYEFKVNIVGTGQDKSYLEYIAKKLKIDHLVNFTGPIKFASELIPNHRALIHVSKMESFGIVITESLSYGVPVIAVPNGGVCEVFTDGIEGIYLDVDDAVISANLIINLLNNEDTMVKLSNNATNSYENKYHPDKLHKVWINEILDDKY